MHFFCISAFKNQIKHFCLDKPNLNLHNSDKYILSFFEDYNTIEKLWQLPNLRTMGNIKVIKHDIKNPDQGRGGRRSSRLIFLVDKNAETVVLLYFFPKYGKEGQENLSKEEYKALLKTYSDEKKQGQLIPVKVFEKNKKDNSRIAIRGLHF